LVKKGKRYYPPNPSIIVPPKVPSHGRKLREILFKLFVMGNLGPIIPRVEIAFWRRPRE
jgi:hypothetical protein